MIDNRVIAVIVKSARMARDVLRMWPFRGAGGVVASRVARFAANRCFHFGGGVDHVFWLIFWIVGSWFVAAEGVLLFRHSTPKERGRRRDVSLVLRDYMHLKGEKLLIYAIALMRLLLAIALALVLIPDIVFRR